MREIKFRAWEKVREGYGETYGGEMYYSQESDEKRACGFVIETNSGYSNDDFEWMQYTGLKDKNGTEIYEGDIVKQECEKPFSDMHGEYTLKEIIFNNGSFLLSYLTSATGDKLPRGYTAMFINDLEDLDNEHLLWSKEPLQIPVEVIGNIYSNPELLNKQQ